MSEMSVDRRIGLNVKGELARRDSNQDKAAAFLHLGAASMSNRIQGKTPFRPAELVALSEWLGVPLHRFFEGVQ